jgi:arylsulfatase A-like enzyme
MCFVVAVAPSGCERSAGDKSADRGKPAATATNLPRPNIIFVVVDALRADRVGAYGHLPTLTPTIDSVAAEGVTFERAIAQGPWTQPSIASVFSSYNPSVHRVFSYSAGVEELEPNKFHTVTVLVDDFRTLAECFKDAGYATFGAVANPVIKADYGFAQGFDDYDTSFADLGDQPTGDVVNGSAIGWLARRDQSKPFFLYLHYMDVHGPYNAGPEFVDDLLDAVERSPQKRLLTPVERSRLHYLSGLPENCPNPQKHKRLLRFREYWVARYEAGIRQFDHHFAGLIARLVEMGLWDDAYTIVTSDHGEALCEHGLWSHGYSTHHTDLHVPLILRWPGKLPAGKWISGNVRLIDLMPTMLAQLSMKAPDGIQGVSLVPLLDDRPLTQPLTAFAEGVRNAPNQQAIYQDAWKLILTMESGRRQLFNLQDDHEEQVDRSLREPDRLGELTALLREQAEVNERLAAEFETRRVDVSPEEVERLKALGYVGD